jgi:hypothetical protein
MPSLRYVAVIAALAAAGAVAGPSAQITAAFDQKGHHPGTAPAKGPATVRCLSAVSDLGKPAGCYIVAPGYAGEVPVGHSIGTSGAGTVTLTCTGQGNVVRCVAQVIG